MVQAGSNTDRRSDGVEKKIPAENARQGRWGMQILIVLLCALILTGVVWLGVEIYGEHLASEPAAVHLNG
jgi:cell division septal protein FtsQ